MPNNYWTILKKNGHCGLGFKHLLAMGGAIYFALKMERNLHRFPTINEQQIHTAFNPVKFVIYLKGNENSLTQDRIEVPALKKGSSLNTFQIAYNRFEMQYNLIKKIKLNVHNGSKGHIT